MHYESATPSGCHLLRQGGPFSLDSASKHEVAVPEMSMWQVLDSVLYGVTAEQLSNYFCKVSHICCRQLEGAQPCLLFPSFICSIDEKWLAIRWWM